MLTTGFFNFWDNHFVGIKGKVRDCGRAWSELPLAIDCQAINFYILATCIYLKTWWKPQIRQDRRKWISELKERNENACACLVNLSLSIHFNCFALILTRLRSICLLIDGKIGVTKNDLIAFEMMGEIAAPFQVNTHMFCSSNTLPLHYDIV